MKLTAQFTKLETAYMGQIIEWPEVITEGNTIDECRESLIDALNEMIQVHKDLNIKLPFQKVIIESFELEQSYVS